MKKIILFCVLGIVIKTEMKAQSAFGVTGKIDFVSDYIWRGAYQNSGFSLQPALGVSYGDLAFTAWGSQSLTKTDGAQEVDLTLSYTLGRFGIAVTDYWWNGISSPYGDYKHDHHFEAALSCSVSETFPLTLGWATMFAGGDDNDEGNRAFSTYISVSYSFHGPADIQLTPLVGFTPWQGMYDADGANITDISFKASKYLQVTDRFSFPVFIQAIASPVYDKAYLIGGVGLGF
jgi:hypothetical protein